MKIKHLKEIIGNQPDDAEVEFIRSINHSNKIIFKVGDKAGIFDLVYL